MIKKTKIPRVTDEGWNAQKQLSVLVEKKKEVKRENSNAQFPIVPNRCYGVLDHL